jgi:hypothetical protein
MSKIYLVRHQAEGLLWQFPFAAPPTEAQQAVLQARCDRVHGPKHPKTEEPYFFKVVELSLLDATDVPAVAVAVSGDSASGGKSEAGLFGSSGAGTVTPKAGS